MRSPLRELNYKMRSLLHELKSKMRSLLHELNCNRSGGDQKMSYMKLDEIIMKT
jgi:hypothetical protein